MASMETKHSAFANSMMVCVDMYGSSFGYLVCSSSRTKPHPVQCADPRILGSLAASGGVGVYRAGIRHLLLPLPDGTS